MVVVMKKPDIYIVCDHEGCGFKTGKSISKIEVITAIALHSVVKHEGQIESIIFDPMPIVYKTKAVE